MLYYESITETFIPSEDTFPKAIYLVNLQASQFLGLVHCLLCFSTIIVEPDCEAKIALDGTVEITLLNVGKSKIGEDVDPIQLSIFSHRFMSIAEQMGSVLQRSAISTNIKVPFVVLYL